jgi:hypothetical protein
MKSGMVVAIAALGALAMGGCAKPKPGSLYAYQQKNTKYRALHTETMMRPDQKIVTKNIEKVQVRFKDDWGFKRKYDALIGPNPNEVEAVAIYKNPIGRWAAEAGWIYASGECPYVETTLVEATAHGTEVTIIVQIEGTKHRVYLLNISGGEWVEFRSPPGVGPWVPWYASEFSSDDYSYIEVDSAPPHTGPFGANGALTGFVNYVVSMSTLAEVPP